MQKLKVVWQWLVKSSADPERISLAVKGFLGGLVTVLTIVFGLAHIQVGSQDLSSIVDAIVSVVQAAAGFVSAIVLVVGLVRKVWLTIKGENPVLN